MKLDEMKNAYNVYNEELDKRKELIRAILTNNKNDYINYEQQFIDLFNKTNIEIYPLLEKMNYEEIKHYLTQSMNNSEYSSLVNFFLLLHGYCQVKMNSNNAQKFNEFKNTLYFELLKWYLPNHGVGSKDREDIINEFTETTAESLSIRNILAKKEELNSIFDNIELMDDFERKIAIDSFVKEVDLFLIFVNMYIIKNKLLELDNNIPKSLILRLVLMNILTKKYQLGFRIEEYITRYYDNHDIGKEFFGEGVHVNKKVLNECVEEYLMEINDITNEFINDYEKRKTI